MAEISTRAVRALTDRQTTVTLLRMHRGLISLCTCGSQCDCARSLLEVYNVHAHSMFMRKPYMHSAVVRVLHKMTLLHVQI